MVSLYVIQLIYTKFQTGPLMKISATCNRELDNGTTLVLPVRDFEGDYRVEVDDSRDGYIVLFSEDESKDQNIQQELRKSGTSE